MYPKLKQLAEQDAEVLWIKVGALPDWGLLQLLMLVTATLTARCHQCTFAHEWLCRPLLAWLPAQHPLLMLSWV